MPGRACEPPGVAGACRCGAKPILDSDGRYNPELLKDTDNEWYVAIMLCTEWEVLSSCIDTEEPGAAHILSQAFNRKNGAAFATTHLEIMRTLVSLVRA